MCDTTASCKEPDVVQSRFISWLAGVARRSQRTPRRMEAVKADTEPLTCLLRAISAGSSADVSSSICKICQHSESLREQVVAMGGLLPLVSMLCSRALPMSVRTAAAHAIFDPAVSRVDEQDAELAIVPADGQALIGQLGAPALDCQATALTATWALCKGSKAVSIQLCQLGAIQPLVRLLESLSTSCQESAAQVICCMCKTSTEIEQALLKVNGLQPLMNLLQSTAAGCQEQALSVILVISSSGECTEALVELGIMVPLTRLLRSSLPSCQQHNAEAIRTVCLDDINTIQQVAKLAPRGHTAAHHHANF